MWPLPWRNEPWRLTISKTHAASYLDNMKKKNPYLHKIAEDCAKAFIKGRNTEPKRRGVRRGDGESANGGN